MIESLDSHKNKTYLEYTFEGFQHVLIAPLSHKILEMQKNVSIFTCKTYGV